MQVKFFVRFRFFELLQFSVVLGNQFFESFGRRNSGVFQRRTPISGRTHYPPPPPGICVAFRRAASTVVYCR